MNGNVDIIHWISYNHANFIVDTVFERFNLQMQKFIRNQLRKKIKKKNDIQMIDSSFVLRILLEYYKRERYNKYKKIKDLYSSDPNKIVS